MRSKLLMFTILACISTQALADDISIKPTYHSTDMQAFSKWGDMQRRWAKQSGADDSAVAGDYNAFVATLSGLPLQAKLDKVNHFFNEFPYIEDQANWGVEDYWSTPYELIRKGGDCEDFAIAKYLALRGAGVPAKSMLLATVYDLKRNGMLHNVLLVTDEDGKRYVLDNQSPMVLPIGKVDRYKLIYTINEDGWYSYY